MDTAAKLVGIFIITLMLSGPTEIARASVSGSAEHDLSVECVLTDAWVDAHPEYRPRTVNELRALPTAYARATFAAMSPDSRRALWYERLSRIVERGRHGEMELDEGQIRALVNVLRNLEHLFTSPPPVADLRKIQETILVEFDVELATEIFASFEEKVEEGQVEVGASMTHCDCASGSIFSCNSITGPCSRCFSGGCTTRGIGCGFLLLQNCDGRCEPRC